MHLCLDSASFKQVTDLVIVEGKLETANAYYAINVFKRLDVGTER